MGAPPESADRITKIRIQGFRSLEDVTLDLNGLSVLIGDNGSGKSAIIEAIETLRYFTDPGATFGEYFLQHPRPVRLGVGVFSVEATIESRTSKPPLTYQIALFQAADGSIGIQEERLDVGPTGSSTEPLHAIQRLGGEARVFDQVRKELVRVSLDHGRSLLSVLAAAPMTPEREVQRQAIERAASVLRGVEVHVPWEVLPSWAARRTARKSASRESSILQRASRLDLLAANLANIYSSLKNDHGTAHWNETLEYVRLGLGREVDDVAVTADAGGGQQAISVHYTSAGLLPAAALSDGTLAYLAFVALLRLPSKRSLLAFDEPELHLHPGLLVRVLSMFESIALQCPVILATHSDRLLDALQEPAKSVILCDLDEHGATHLRRPDPDLLREWLRDYNGFGEIRDAGLQSAVMQVREGGSVYPAASKDAGKPKAARKARRS